MTINDLLKGNKDFLKRVDKNLLKKLSQAGQHPVATVVSCSDSRVPVEILFDQTDPGKLFVIRTAGNIIADPSVTGSIEYAVSQLKTPYLIVLGHTGCGAVKARLDGAEEGEIGKLVRHIKVKSNELDKAVIENVHNQVRNSLTIDSVKKPLEQAKLEIYGMLYDLGTGKITSINKNGTIL